MVEYAAQLDSIFASLADPTRRDILARVARAEYSISELAANYRMSLAAISKHLMVMERARLVSKRKEGKQHIVSLAPDALKTADEYLEQYRCMWQSRFEKLDRLIQ
ncbi:winged helix-turn-helix transcriptional regulator [Candidatus Saccharibacteria bacterium]|nr:winged helix-turn-helix transcriptional regulator [Candidatus Saccharibacteria bacterium]